MDEMRSSGVEPGEGCNVMALKACAAAGRWEKTLEMLRDMRASAVNRSESSFVVAMKACGDAGRWEEALGLMDDMRRDGIPPMETTYTTAVRNITGGGGGGGDRVLLCGKIKRFRSSQVLVFRPRLELFSDDRGQLGSGGGVRTLKVRMVMAMLFSKFCHGTDLLGRMHPHADRSNGAEGRVVF